VKQTKNFGQQQTNALTIASSIDLFWLAWCDMSTTQKNKSWLTRTREPSGSVLTTIMVFFLKKSFVATKNRKRNKKKSLNKRFQTI
jgi:hypothetical protein